MWPSCASWDPLPGQAVGQQGQLPPGVMMFTRIVTTVTVACIYVFLPALFLLLCNHKSVRETCRRRDSKIAWTERCPMPVLALCLILVFSGLSMFSLAGYNWTMPLFGFLFLRRDWSHGGRGDCRDFARPGLGQLPLVGRGLVGNPDLVAGVDHQFVCDTVAVGPPHDVPEDGHPPRPGRPRWKMGLLTWSPGGDRGWF